jgi:hypothetical protein
MYVRHFPPSLLVPAFHGLHNTWQVDQHRTVHPSLDSDNSPAEFAFHKSNGDLCTALLWWYSDSLVSNSISQIVGILSWLHTQDELLLCGRVLLAIAVLAVVRIAGRPIWHATFHIQSPEHRRGWLAFLLQADARSGRCWGGRSCRGGSRLLSGLQNQRRLAAFRRGALGSGCLLVVVVVLGGALLRTGLVPWLFTKAAVRRCHGGRWLFGRRCWRLRQLELEAASCSWCLRGWRCGLAIVVARLEGELQSWWHVCWWAASGRAGRMDCLQ